MARLTCVALLLLALCASTALAAPPWSAPESVSSASLFVDNPDVVFTADGRAIATWRWSGAKPSATADAPGGWRLAVREPGALDFGPERTAPKFVTPLIPYGLDRLIALDTRQPGKDESRITLRARYGRSDGTFGRPRTISTYRPDVGTPSLAAPNGSVAAWIANGPRGRRVVRAALKRSGGRFSRPFTLRDRGRAHDVVAGAALGVLFVAWERGGVVEARVKLAGRRWGRVQRLGPSQPFATTFAVTGSGRRAYLAWVAQAAESAVLRVAALPAARSRFRRYQTIDTIEHQAPGDGNTVGLVPIPDRDALLAWSDWDGARWRVRATTTNPGRGADFDVQVDVSPAGQSSVLGDAAAAPLGTPVAGGTTMLVWSVLDAVGELGNHVQAAIRPPGGSFAPAEDVSDLDRARLPAVAFDSNGHRWTTLWSQRMGPDGPGVPLSQITTFARSSTRPG